VLRSSEVGPFVAVGSVALVNGLGKFLHGRVRFYTLKTQARTEYRAFLAQAANLINAGSREGDAHFTGTRLQNLTTVTATNIATWPALSY
jgi:hypothetical protein